MAPSAFLKPPPWHRVESFLGDALVEDLFALAKARRADFRETRIGAGDGMVHDRAYRQSLILPHGGAVLQPLLHDRFAEILPAAVAALKVTPFACAQIELQLVAHGDGAFYREHIDIGVGSTPANRTRALTGVYYFHRQPKRFTGGELRLWALLPAPDGTRAFTDIPPDHDTLVLFPSWAPHEVRPVACPSGEFLDSRFAVNCWFHGGG